MINTEHSISVLICLTLAITVLTRKGANPTEGSSKRRSLGGSIKDVARASICLSPPLKHGLPCCRLARTVRTNQGHNLPLGHVKADVEDDRLLSITGVKMVDTEKHLRTLYSPR